MNEKVVSGWMWMQNEYESDQYTQTSNKICLNDFHQISDFDLIYTNMSDGNYYKNESSFNENN